MVWVCRLRADAQERNPFAGVLDRPHGGVQADRQGVVDVVVAEVDHVDAAGAEGARGLQAAGHALVIADDPSEFAAACAHLLTTPLQRSQLGEAAWNYTRDHFSPQACFAPFVGWLHGIRASKEPVHG